MLTICFLFYVILPKLKYNYIPFPLPFLVSNPSSVELPLSSSQNHVPFSLSLFKTEEAPCKTSTFHASMSVFAVLVSYLGSHNCRGGASLSILKDAIVNLTAYFLVLCLFTP